MFTFYIWLKVPNAIEFTKKLYEKKNIKVLPGSFLGREGMGSAYVRIALVENSKKTKKILEKYNPRAVINFAAETHVDRSIEDPEIFVNTNILGTFHLLNASLKLQLSMYSTNLKISPPRWQPKQ